MIRTVKTKDEFQSVYKTLASQSDGLSSFTMPLLIRKTGDLRNVALLKEVVDAYIASRGYDSVVVESAISEYLYLHKMDPILSLYHSFRRSHTPLLQSTYERFLSTLLLYSGYERICLNITKEMLRQNYSISRRFLVRCLDLVETRSSNLVIALIAITSPRELPLQLIQTILHDKIIAFSAANRQVSVWELYKYLCVLSPDSNKASLEPYLCKSLCYFVSRYAYPPESNQKSPHRV